MLRAHYVFPCFLAGILSFAQTPRPAYSDPAAPPFIVRLQRNRSDKSVCAIVRGDGLFHVESETANHFDVSEGTLDDPELANIKAALSNKEIVALSQQQIPSPLLITNRDEFFISILRSPLTQNLTFTDRESRQPFDDFINPLVHWLDALQHHRHTSLGEFEGRNNCMPQKKLEFSPRRTAPPPSAAPSEPGKSDLPTDVSGRVPATSQRDAFLMRWQFNHISRGAVADTCIVVYLSGRYRLEKSTQGHNEKLKFRAFEDVLDTPDLEQLEALLNDSALKSSTHHNLPGGKIFQEGELTTLTVSRGGLIQQLSFASYFGVPGWVSNVSAGTDPEERIVTPLRKWLRNHVEAKKATALQNSVLTHCVPQRQETHP